jgi:hypothetical protein
MDFLFFLFFLLYINCIMNNKDDITIKICYVGKQGNFFKDLHHGLYKNKEHLIIQIDSLNMEQDGAKKLYEQFYDYILVDFDSLEKPFFKELEEIKTLFLNKKPIVIGLASNLDDEIEKMMSSYKVNFIYEKTSTTEEALFLATTILYTHSPVLKQKGKYAIARAEMPSVINVPVYLKEFNFQYSQIETPFKLNNKTLSKIESPLLDKVNFGHTNISVELLLNNSYHPNNNYTISLKNSHIKASELAFINEEVEKLASINKNLKTELQKKNFIKDQTVLKYKSLLSEKKFIFDNLYKSHYLYCQNPIKKNILITSKDGLDEKIKNEAVHDHFRFFKQSNIDPKGLFLNKYPMDFIFYNYELLPEKDEEGKPIEVKDNAFKYNHNQSIKELTVHLNKHQKDLKKIIIFNPNRLPHNEIMNSILYSNFEIIDQPFSMKFVESFLDDVVKIENKEAKKQLFKKQNTLEMKKTLKKTEIKRKSLFFANTDTFGKANIALDITVDYVTENEIFISSDNELPHYTPIKINFPTECYLTIIKDDKWERDNHRFSKKRYRAIINGISYTKRNDLRAFVINNENQMKRIS